MITVIMLINIFITFHSYMCVVRTLNIYSLSKFVVYSVVLLTIITMFYTRALELAHLINKNLYPKKNIFPLPPTPGNHYFTL